MQNCNFKLQDEYILRSLIYNMEILANNTVLYT